MSKKFKSQASSARAASAVFGAATFSAPPSAFQTISSPLSYVTEQLDLSGISDPNVVVAFKNLSKKDSVTKSKALEELQEYLAAPSVSAAGIEPGILEAWINIYPRASIDNSRRVRQLAHSLQGSITVACGKRILPSLPAIIGPWLAGAFDSDKSVSAAAQDALLRAFTTEEKRKAVWKMYRDSLVRYSADAILRETPQSLSDERTTSPDDSEAKYVRVVSTAAFVLNRLVSNSSSHKGKGDSELDRLLSEPKLWELASHTDPYLRRSIYSLASSHLSGDVLDTDWSMISTFFLAKALNVSQLGSSRQYSDVLVTITKVRPTIWTTDYTSKSSVNRKLLQFLRKGSQRGPEEFWTNIGRLIPEIPFQALKSNKENANQADDIDYDSLLSALHEGVSNSEEPRPNALVAWTTYIKTCFWLFDTIDNSERGEKLLEEHVTPMVTQYNANTAENLQWSTPATVSLKTSASFLTQLAVREKYNLFEKIWSRQVDLLIDVVRLSMPETSRDFKISQDAVIESARRLFALQSATKIGLRTAENASKTEEILNSNSDRLVEVALGVLKARNGKPYGAAGLVAAALTHNDSKKIVPQLDKIFSDDMAVLLKSPSSEQLVSILFLCHHYPSYSKGLGAAVKILLLDTDSTQHPGALERLLKEITPEDLTSSEGLEPVLMRDLDAALEGDSSKWPFIRSIMTNQMLNGVSSGSSLSGSPTKSNLQVQILDKMLANLEIDDKQDASLSGFATLLATGDTRSAHIPDQFDGNLFARLLLISDSENEPRAELATKLTSKLKSLMLQRGSSAVASSTADLIHNQLMNTDQPMSVFGMIELAQEIFNDSSTDTKGHAAARIFPANSHWQAALEPFLDIPPAPASAVTSPLQGLVFAIEPLTNPSTSTGVISRDAEGFSQALRLTLYVTKVLNETNILGHIGAEQKRALYLYYPQVLQLINNKLTLDISNTLWLISSPEVIEEVADLLSLGQKLMRAWIENQADESRMVWLAQMQNLQGNKSNTYNLGLVFTSIMTELVDLEGPKRYLDLWENDIEKLNRSTDLVKSAALTSIFGGHLSTSALGKRLCNELVSDVTELKDLKHPIPSLRPLVLLNILLHGDDGLLDTLPSQRVVFLLKNLVALLTSEYAPYALISEVLKLLCSVVPVIREIYGEHWEKMLDAVVKLWNHGNNLNEDLATLHSSLKFYARFESLTTKDEANEDLMDAWNNRKQELQLGLLQVLKLFEGQSVGSNQPRGITAELLKRQLSHVSITSTAGTDELYHLLASEEQQIQTAAYEILHRAIPAAQERASLDLALERKKTHLPEELLSLLLGVPNLQALLQWGRSKDLVWLDVRRYLLSWKVVFDHFDKASYRLKEIYLNDIKESHHLPELLVFICELLRISSGRPVDASKFDIDSINLDESEFLEKEIQELSIHVYYLCLLCVPSLTKDWFISQKNRIKSPLESWTQKHITPHIVSASLAAVAEWAATQDPDDRPIVIKSSPKGSELVASIAIDEESPPISLAISMPGAYPLEQAAISSRNRVGVSEKNWQSWLRTFQIIVFSSGSLIEGLVAFRRNVAGALKGQTECAICYSIIGTDMQTPNKKCGTCKNCFHSVCLFRWFKSSSSSSCPLCRNNFNYA